MSTITLPQIDEIAEDITRKLLTLSEIPRDVAHEIIRVTLVSHLVEDSGE